MQDGGWTAEAIKAQLAELGPWFHNIDLRGVWTAPDHFLGDYPAFKWRGFAHALPEDLTGRSVLDIGCNGGFYAIEMKRRGADHVVAVDSDPRYLKQAAFAAEVLGHRIEFRQMDVYQVSELRQRFDLVLFMGVLYHLRHPLLALDLLYEYAVDDLLLFQSMQRGPDEVEAVASDYDFDDQAHFERPAYPSLYFVEDRYAGDPTNWWIPNRGAAEAMLRSSGFEIVSHPEREVYICRRGRRPYGVSLPSPPARRG